MSKNYYVRDTKSGDVHRTSNTDYWKGYEVMNMAEGKRVYREQCAKDLRKLLKPGATVYVKQTSVSRSGMFRRLELYVVKGGALQRITHSASVVMDWSHNDDGIAVSGCGMDMHFHTVYTLARYLFPKGFKQKGRDGKTEEKDGGYALKHSTI